MTVDARLTAEELARVNARIERLENACEELAEAILRHEWAKDLHNIEMLRHLTAGEWAEFQKLLEEERS